MEGPEAAEPVGIWCSAEWDAGTEGGVAGTEEKVEACWNSDSANTDGVSKYDCGTREKSVCVCVGGYGGTSIGYENMSTKLGSMAIGWKYADCFGRDSTASMLDRREVLMF
jgi:hypothetical protein